MRRWWPSAKQEFMLVLTDWNMPNKNGLELIQGIRATGSTVPIIMITTESEKARVFSAIEAGVTRLPDQAVRCGNTARRKWKNTWVLWLRDVAGVRERSRTIFTHRINSHGRIHGTVCRFADRELRYDVRVAKSRSGNLCRSPTCTRRATSRASLA